MTSIVQQFRPLYGSTFRCIGADCEDTCCHGLGVLLDKKTYDRYQSLPVGSTRSLVQRHVSLNTIGASDTLYAKITPTRSNVCPFFAQDGLCGMQKEFGHDYLSATCSIYPRVLNRVDEELETSLYLSCPEATRIVLLDPNSMQANTNASPNHYPTDQFSRLATNNEGSIYKPYAYFHEVRALVITMIRDRSRPLWQRLFLLGMMCRDLNEITAAEQDSAVPRILDDYQEIVATCAMREEMESVPEKPAEQLDVVLRLTGECIRRSLSGPRFRECFQQFIEGIGYSSEPASVVPRYLDAEKEFFRPFVEQHPFIIENYLLNYVFRTLFPFGRAASAHNIPQSILGEYTMMATQYAMVKGLLVGMAGYHQERFSAEHVVKLIQAFSKVVEHNPTFLQEVKEFVNHRKIGTPEGMVILLKCSTVEGCRIVTETERPKSRKPVPLSSNRSG